jgi:hypothetical protein
MDVIKQCVYYKLTKMFGDTSAVYVFCYKNVVMYFSELIYMKPGSFVWDLLPGILMLTVGFWFFFCVFTTTCKI